jgi:hypothetical protein
LQINNYKFTKSTNYKLIIVNFQLNKLQVCFCKFACLQVYKIKKITKLQIIITTLQIASSQVWKSTKLQILQLNKLQVRICKFVQVRICKFVQVCKFRRLKTTFEVKVELLITASHFFPLKQFCKRKICNALIIVEAQ